MEMRLISLNIWGGHVRNPLLEFVASQQKVDIFCFQEVYKDAKHKISDDDRVVSLDIFSELHALLPEHQGFFKPVVGHSYGIGMFVKKGIEVLEEGSLVIHENPNYRGKGPTHSRNLQWAKCRIGDREHFIVNVHGLWNGKGKTDCPERIQQSQRIRTFLDSILPTKIVCGDFNLRPDTQSVKIIEQGMKNLIQDYNIASTRTSLYEKAEKFADYIFTSLDLNIHAFEVLKDEVSDHAPLFLEFDL
jgi:endonuclease/exonuclease/phosphatase family metal-dependent hydrolase